MLVSKSEFKTYVDFSNNVEDEKINIHIQNVERVELKPILGETLYARITSATPDPVLSQLETTLLTDYIKPFVILAAYSRFTRVHGKSITQAGWVHVTDATYDQLSKEEKEEARLLIRKDLAFYEMELKKFISENNLIPTEPASCAGTTTRATGGFGFRVLNKPVNREL